jgi:hypothetical protein
MDDSGVFESQLKQCLESWTTRHDVDQSEDWAAHYQPKFQNNGNGSATAPGEI